jgi:outer membrane protein assembly factor BamE (lipoprotein component of BamABCDE complex)
LDLSFEPGPIKKVDLAGWQQLEIGMTESQVEEVLGKPDSKLGRSTFTLGGEETTTPQTWEYDWTIGLSLVGNTHPKSYLVRFDSDGKLASWREPIDQQDPQSNPEQDAAPKP